MTRIEDAIARLREAREKASKDRWGSLPGCGDNEDDGTMLIGAVGPDYAFLIGDEWEYEPDPIPMGTLSEDEARRRAGADQAFIALSANVWAAMVDLIEYHLPVCCDERVAIPLEARLNILADLVLGKS